MTIQSLRCLGAFLNYYKPSGRIADYGGTDRIGAPIVKKMLALNNVVVKDDDPGVVFNLHIQGVEKKVVPQYVVLDYDSGVDLLKPIRGKKFDAGICMDLLEHVSNPFIVAKNISNSLQKNALLFVTAPWIWEIHEYPKDYWRFSPQGIQELFPDMKALHVEIIRDESSDEELPRARIVAIFKKK